MDFFLEVGLLLEQLVFDRKEEVAFSGFGTSCLDTLALCAVSAGGLIGQGFIEFVEMSFYQRSVELVGVFESA